MQKDKSKIFSHLEMNYDFWWHHKKESVSKHSLLRFLIFEAAAAKELAQKACGWDLTVGDGVEIAEET